MHILQQTEYNLENVLLEMNTRKKHDCQYSANYEGKIHF